MELEVFCPSCSGIMTFKCRGSWSSAYYCTNHGSPIEGFVFWIKESGYAVYPTPCPANIDVLSPYTSMSILCDNGLLCVDCNLVHIYNFDLFVKLSTPIIDFVRKCFEDGNFAQREWHRNFPKSIGEMQLYYANKIRDLLNAHLLPVLTEIVICKYF